MVGVAHQTPGVDSPVGFLAGLGHRPDEVGAVYIVSEDILASVATAPEALHRCGILHSHLARHRESMGGTGRLVQA